MSPHRAPLRTTHVSTFAILELSRAAYDEIAAKLIAAGYASQFSFWDEHGTVIDMQGIGVVGPSTHPTETVPLPRRTDLDIPPPPNSPLVLDIDESMKP